MEEEILHSMKDYMGRLRRDERQKVYAPLADCYLRTGLLGDAEEIALTGLDVFPTYLLCREVLGKVYFKLGRLEEAKLQLEKVANIIKDNPELSRVIGKLYMQLDMDDFAREHFELVIKKDPFDFEIHNLLIELNEKSLPQAEPESDDGRVDMFSQSVEEKITDIEAIIAQMEAPEVLDKEKYSKATDDALDFIEDVEDDIDAKADELFAHLQQEMEEIAPVRKIRPTVNQEILMENRKEIHAAAVIGQVHMEIHLLDEVLITAKKLLNKTPDDQDLKILCSKFEGELYTKEEELDRLEGSAFATGL